MGNTPVRERTLHGAIAPTLPLSGACGIRLEDQIHLTEAGAPWLSEPAHRAEEPIGLEARR